MVLRRDINIGDVGLLVIDARFKPTRPPLLEDEEVSMRVDQSWPRYKNRRMGYTPIPSDFQRVMQKN